MAKRKKDRSGRYVSRGGDKLERALTAFGIDVTGMVSADLGANVGGFTDCLLQHGAARVYAVETGYGVLDWKLRQDDRVVVMELTNVLHVDLNALVDVVVSDVGWTPLRRYVPRALQMLKPGGSCVALLKSQYEVDRSALVDGHVGDEHVEAIVASVVEELKGLPCRVEDVLDPGLDVGGRNAERFVWIKP